MVRHTTIDKKTTKNNHSRENTINQKTKKSPRKSPTKPQDFFSFNDSLSLEEIPSYIPLGIAAVGLAGIATFLLLKPKKKTRLLEKNVYDIYEDLKEEAEELAHNAYEKGKEAYEHASEYAENIKDVIEHPDSKTLFIAGTVGGSILGASLIYLLTRDGSKNDDLMNRTSHIFESIKDAANSASENVKLADWPQIAKEVIESLTQKITNNHENDEEEEEEGNNKNHHYLSHLQNAIELGVNGFRLWQNLNKKKRR